VLLHVDDLKVAWVIEYVIEMSNREYTKSNVCEGSKLDYLGMIFNYGSHREVSKMVLEFLKEFDVPEEARKIQQQVIYSILVTISSSNLGNSGLKVHNSHGSDTWLGYASKSKFPNNSSLGATSWLNSMDLLRYSGTSNIHNFSDFVAFSGHNQIKPYP